VHLITVLVNAHKFYMSRDTSKFAINLNELSLHNQRVSTNLQPNHTDVVLVLVVTIKCYRMSASFHAIAHHPADQIS
jgi:hypothetical protein